MLTCYFLSLCLGSSVDETTHNISMFNLVEEIRVPSAALGQVVPIEVHAYFMTTTEGKNRAFEMRVVRRSSDGARDPGGVIPFATRDGERVRSRAMAMRLPGAFGTYTLHVEWRPAGTEIWIETGVMWPLLVGEERAPEETPSPPSTSPP